MAHYDLDLLRKLIDAGRAGPSLGKAINPVIEVYRDSRPMTTKEAGELINRGMKELIPDNFASSHMQNGIVVDKYGFYFDGHPWFVKFYIENDFVEQVSFHPPEEPIKTSLGIVSKGTNK